MKTPHYLTPLSPMLSDDIHAMTAICHGIARRRSDEALMLPAPEGWSPPPRLPVKLIVTAVVIIHLAAAAFGFWIA
jgi:hypothetical protein